MVLIQVVLANVVHRTFAAFWIARRANITPMQNKPMVGVLHVTGWDTVKQVLFHVLWRCSVRKTKPGAYAQKMGVHGHGWLSEHNIKDDIGGFPAHSRKPLQLLTIARNLPVVFFYQHTAKFHYVLGL